MKEFAVLMTSFNRRMKTVACIESVLRQGVSVDIYLVDDGSSDGTQEEVSSLYGNVNIIKGDGNLYWSRGMRKAWGEAGKKDYRYYVWLNDDSILYDFCFKELIECAGLLKNKAVIVGIVCDKNDGKVIYGGVDTLGVMAKPNGCCQHINNMNGNIVLVSKEIFLSVGNIDGFFHHDLGDVDYGLRVKKAGFDVVTTRLCVGLGYRNEICRVRLKESGLIARFKKLYSPLGSPPFINAYFRCRHFGVVNALAYFIFLHVINLMPDWMVGCVFKNKYF